MSGCGNKSGQIMSVNSYPELKIFSFTIHCIYK